VTDPGPRGAGALRRGFGPGYVLLALASVVLAVVGPLPLAVGVGLAIGGATLSSLVRAWAPRRGRYLGLLPALFSLGVLAAYSPLWTVSELLAGVAGLALLLWCAEEPDRRPGALARGLTGVFVPAAALGIAWTSSLLLPSGLGTVGIAAALLGGSATAIILLLRVPRVFDRDPAATS
jgi:hypothetical protein